MGCTATALLGAFAAVNDDAPAAAAHGMAVMGVCGEIAAALRRGTPKLLDLVNRFLATTKKGTAYGNILTKRYYAEIMMPFRRVIARHLDRLADYDIAMLAPSHGPIWASPELILEAYDEWVSGPPP